METDTATPGVRMCHKLTSDHVWLLRYVNLGFLFAFSIKALVYYLWQVMSESIASALHFIDPDGTEQTRLFIRMVSKFFDCMNAKGPQLAKVKRKDNIAPYMRPTDERFRNFFLVGLMTHFSRSTRESV